MATYINLVKTVQCHGDEVCTGDGQIPVAPLAKRALSMAPLNQTAYKANLT